MSWLKTLYEIARDMDVTNIPTIANAHRGMEHHDGTFWSYYGNKSMDNEVVHLARQVKSQAFPSEWENRVVYQFHEGDEPNHFTLVELDLPKLWLGHGFRVYQLIVRWVGKGGSLVHREYGPSEILITNLSFDSDMNNLSYDSIFVNSNNEAVNYVPVVGEDIFSNSFANDDLTRMNASVAYGKKPKAIMHEFIESMTKEPEPMIL